MAAYVIAHEVAHHVQNELSILPKVDQARRASSTTEANALTVRLEVMVYCLSGVWARNVEGLHERGDLEEALNAARMISDDHLQRQAAWAQSAYLYVWHVGSTGALVRCGF